MSLAALLRALRPRRTIRPTRDGWWCLGAAVGLGFAAMNTGNNLLYLLASLLLGLIIVSGILSEQSMRRLRLAAVVPDEIYAGRAAVVGARVRNLKRRLSTYSVALEVDGRRLYVDRLPAGDERLVTWEARFDARGRGRLPGVRVTTRFPFGLFVKAGRLALDEEVVVFPAVRPLEGAWRRRLGAGAARPLRRRGRGHDLYNLREYRAGDDPRLIHWRSSAKTGALVVRELEAETALDTRIVLVGDGTRDGARLEAALSEAASLAAHLTRAEAAVELLGPGLHVPAGRGRAHLRRLLTALALYQARAVPAPPRPRRRAGVGEIEIALG
ncbi:MAG: DUF58 domain-containing protein [Candidatus Rokuibacteriota bacterium]|nr:MAG: DUF58 domain-containing protein [Candidatus Rokubacteria bacterium]